MSDNLPVKHTMKPNRRHPIRGYITKCLKCGKPGAMYIHLQKEVEAGMRFVTCVECNFEGEVHKLVKGLKRGFLRKNA